MGHVLRYSPGGSKVEALGLYRCPGNPPFACIKEHAKCSYITQDAYRERRLKPNFDDLPWEAEFRAAKYRVEGRS